MHRPKQGFIHGKDNFFRLLAPNPAAGGKIAKRCCNGLSPAPARNAPATGYDTARLSENLMKKNYNYTRRKLFLPEYGRHIHEMIDSLSKIEDRHERNRQARAVIAVMGNLFPLLRDTADFTHKLWDHLFIMSDFQLDVDSPYPQPSRQELTMTPHRMRYTQHRIGYKHYGKYVEQMIRQLGHAHDPQAVSQTVDNLARYMRAKSYEYNQDYPNNEVIVRDIERISEGAIKIDEQTLNKFRNDHKQHFSARPQRGPMRSQQRTQHNRNQQRNRNFQKNNGPRRNSSR